MEKLIDFKINEIYKNQEVFSQMQQVFENEGFIQLSNFFQLCQKEVFSMLKKEELIEIFKPQYYRFKEINWKKSYNLETIKLMEFFQSKEFLDFIEDIVQFELTIENIKLTHYSHRDYLLLNDCLVENEDKIDIIFDLSCDFEENMGGNLVYTTKEEELLYISPAFNSLTIVFKPNEVMKYLKYINCFSKKEGVKREILRVEIKCGIPLA